MKIFLVGMPGSGKSTLGLQLSKKLNVPFIDLDRRIEVVASKSIPEIFREFGEPHFRELEAKLLRTFTIQEKEFVMATGGGAPCFHDSMTFMNESGQTIFIDVPIEELVQRTKSDVNRPLLQTNHPEVTLATLYQNRIGYYNKASVSVSNATVEKVLGVLNRGSQL